jgi:hypothetical protein
VDVGVEERFSSSEIVLAMELVPVPVPAVAAVGVAVGLSWWSPLVDEVEAEVAATVSMLSGSRSEACVG